MALRLTWVTGLWGELATSKIFKDNCCYPCICFSSKSYSRSGLVYKVSWDLLTVIQPSQKKAVAVGLTLRDGLSNYSVFLRRDLFRAHLFSIYCYWNWLRIISEKASLLSMNLEKDSHTGGNESQYWPKPMIRSLRSEHWSFYVNMLVRIENNRRQLKVKDD